MANIPEGKTRDVNKPYAVYQDDNYPEWEWRVLKHYQTPEKEKTNLFARVFCAVKSPFTFDEWEYGDTYISNIGKKRVDL